MSKDQPQTIESFQAQFQEFRKPATLASKLKMLKLKGFTPRMMNPTNMETEISAQMPTSGSKNATVSTDQTSPPSGEYYKSYELNESIKLNPQDWCIRIEDLSRSFAQISTPNESKVNIVAEKINGAPKTSKDFPSAVPTSVEPLEGLTFLKALDMIKVRLSVFEGENPKAQYLFHSKPLNRWTVQGKQNRLYYLIDWTGYLPADRSWEPKASINANAKIQEFHSRYPNKPGGTLLEEGVVSRVPENTLNSQSVVSGTLTRVNVPAEHLFAMRCICYKYSAHLPTHSLTITNHQPTNYYRPANGQYTNRGKSIAYRGNFNNRRGPNRPADYTPKYLNGVSRKPDKGLNTLKTGLYKKSQATLATYYLSELKNRLKWVKSPWRHQILKDRYQIPFTELHQNSEEEVYNSEKPKRSNWYHGSGIFGFRDHPEGLGHNIHVTDFCKRGAQQDSSAFRYNTNQRICDLGKLQNEGSQVYEGLDTPERLYHQAGLQVSVLTCATAPIVSQDVLALPPEPTI
ncbi:hypothetical protein BB558_000785 [Smittium angustum]|uniref:Chromo domain-containing protein n=1 Tax=Smittium angustum TaxID=133377 RepID=A0A2U1JDH6_SMIAN|nr:hypothetical protein BB558_000785 [Smittium angustum]